MTAELTFGKWINSSVSGVALEFPTAPSRPRVAQLELERSDGRDMTAYDRMMCGRWLAVLGLLIPVLLVFNYLRIPDNPLVDDVLKVENDVCVGKREPSICWAGSIRSSIFVISTNFACRLSRQLIKVPISAR
ncbi:MAG: hypothetical protein WAK55_22190 [Xanthobacteraceae bacterium]